MKKDSYIVLHDNDDCEGHRVDVITYEHGRKPSSGPARVATDSYRQNWETIFGGKTVTGQA